MLLYAFNSMSEVKTIYIFFVYDFQDLEAVLFWGGSGSRNFFIRSRLRLRLLVKENIIFEFLKTDYELSKIRYNTCTSTCMSYFMFTLEKTSNDVKFHVLFVNY